MTRPRFRLRGVLLIGMLIPMVLIGLVAVVVTQALTVSLDDSDQAARSEQILVAGNQVTQDVTDAETGVRGYVITGDLTFLEPYTRGTGAFSGDSAALAALVATDASQLVRVQGIQATFLDWNQHLASAVIDAVRTGGLSNAAHLIASGDGNALVDRIRSQLTAVIGSERDQAVARFAATRDATVNVRRFAFWGTLLAIVFALVLAIVLARRLSRRVAAVSAAAASLAAGNLAERVPVSGHDEVADLAASFNAMAERLEDASTSERSAVDVLRKRTTETENANRELEAFSYSVSHDLRAPLRSIDGFSQALLEDYGPQLDANARDYIGRVRAASVRMAALIDDLLRLSRLTRDTVHEETVNLSELAAGVVADLRAADPGRTVYVVIQPDLTARGDARLIRVALENLIGNAWKFTRERPDARIDVCQENGPDGPAFVVADNGAGFDMHYAANLFAPFQRMHPVERFAGTGIGLATVQRIVHRHAGTIQAESEVGQGARFRFTLADANAAPPMAPTPAAAPAAQAAPAPPAEGVLQRGV